MIDEALRERRLANWRQTPDLRLAGPNDGAALIERVGIATLFPVSPELPNLYHAYVGDPEAPTDSKHDSPSGEVYGWRWTLGWRQAAFYGVIARGKPTLVSWPLLPAMLRLRGELESPQTLYAAGTLSADAWRVAQALDASGGVLSTGDLRAAAGFPTGKVQRAAYLKAVAELDAGMLLAKVFADGDRDMQHALVRFRYPDQFAAAQRMTRRDALGEMLQTYLPQAVYAIPRVLAKDLRLPEHELREGLDRLVAAGLAQRMPTADGRAERYVTVSA